jgi:hypothetical protein
MNRSIGSSGSLPWLIAVLLCCLTCAAAVTVRREDVPEAVQDFQASVATGEGLSQISLQYLRMHNLDATTAEDPVAFFDADGNNTAMRSTVIFAHSMGGLIAKTVVTDSGSKIVEAYVTVPFEELEIAPEDKEAFGKMMFFESRPFVKRIVFIAVAISLTTTSGGPDDC